MTATLHQGSKEAVDDPHRGLSLLPYNRTYLLVDTYAGKTAQRRMAPCSVVSGAFKRIHFRIASAYLV